MDQANGSLLTTMLMLLLVANVVGLRGQSYSQSYETIVGDKSVYWTFLVCL